MWKRLWPEEPNLRRRAMFIAAAVGLAFFALVSAGALKVTSQPSFCSSCHEMQGEYVTWSVSSHSQVACVTCHIEPGAINLVKHKITAIGQLYLHVTNKVPAHIEMKDKIPNSVCQQCHTERRQVTASGDLQVPHEKHLDEVRATPYCVDCHAGVVHAGVAGKEGSHVSHERLRALGNVAAKDFRPAMAACIKCHQERQVTVACQNCHRQIQTPATHRAANWKEGHGASALRTSDECLFCHDIAEAKQPFPGDRPVVAGVRANAFCTNCHLNKPRLHDAAWLLGHKRGAGADLVACLVCHDEKPPEPGMSPIVPSTSSRVVACSQCHSSTHREGWLKAHPERVKREGMVQCFKCHQAPDCQSCHRSRNVGQL